jgi:hypothetical protein
MMASENHQLFLGHAQIVKPLMNSENFYFSKGSNLDNKYLELCLENTFYMIHIISGYYV